MVWLLATLFVLFNLMDIGVSWLAIQIGASEVGLLYHGEFWGMALNKMLLAIFITGLLVWASNRWSGAIRVLAGLNIAWLLLLAWNAYVLRSLLG